MPSSSLQLIAGLNEIGLCVVVIGLELGQLQIDTLKVGGADVAGSSRSLLRSTVLR